jgi:poly-D-alanine transfer protein DltD
MKPQMERDEDGKVEWLLKVVEDYLAEVAWSPMPVMKKWMVSVGMICCEWETNYAKVKIWIVSNGESGRFSWFASMMQFANAVDCTFQWECGLILYM